MSLQELKQALDEGRALEQILESEVVIPGRTPSDLTSLKVVLQCTNIGEQYLQSKSLTSEWNIDDDLVRAYVPPRNWPNSNTPRSNISWPVILEAIETLMPQTHLAFFSDPQPFQLDPKGRTTPAAARATSKLASWAVDVSGFEEEIRLMEKSTMTYGQCVGKWGWKIAKSSKKRYSRGEGGQIAIKSDDAEIPHPTFENVDLRNLIVDPTTRSHDIRKSGWRVYQKFIDAVGLDDLRKDGTYQNVPTWDELKMILATLSEPTKDSLQAGKALTWRENQAERQDVNTSPDPMKQPLELLEYEDNGKIITVLQRCIVIRNEENEEGCHYVSCSFIDVLNAFYGFGVAKLLEGEQRFQAGVGNLYVDGLGLTLNPTWQRKGGIGSKSQNITVGPGKVVNGDGELIPLPMNNISDQALNAIQASEARASRRVGANFGQNMPTQAMRTAEGVQDFTSGVQVRLQYFVNNFAQLVFIPVIEAFIGMIKDNLTPDEINQLLTDEDGKSYEGDVLEVYNGDYCVDVLSSTKLAGRRGMQSIIPLMMQLLGQPAIATQLNTQGKKFDFNEFFNEVFDITGWPSTGLIVDMTPEDLQRMQQSNPAVVNAQAKEKATAQGHTNDLEKIQAKGEATAGTAVIKHVLKESEVPKPAKPLATKK